MQFIKGQGEKSLANFTPIFVLAGMLILTPTITEKALGITFAFVRGDGTCTPGCTVVIDNYVLSSGRWVKTPVLDGWVTEGPPPFGGDEKGTVTYKISAPGIVQNVKMSFFNPSSGPNTCSAIVTSAGHGITAQCNISGGSLARADYLITINLGKNAKKTAASLIGSKTFLTVTTKVSGGTMKPSDFTITVSGNSPSPKSFSGSSSGTSVTLSAGKFKVTGKGPSGYNIAYSSGCSGTASGGVPIKCTVSNQYTSLPGSSTFLSVITKVDNTNGGTKKPSDFTITVSGNSPSPKSFSGSSSGTSVTLNAGKYKVTGSGPSGYTTTYSSGCSGTASGGVPIKCIISSTFSTSGGGSGTSNSSSTTNTVKG